MTNVRRIALIMTLLACAACSKKMDSMAANPPPATDGEMTGFYQIQDPAQADDEGTPTRLHIFVNSNGMQEIEFCSVNGSRGFTAWDDGTGAHHFSTYPYIGQLKKYEANVTRVDGKGLQLNGNLEYVRYQPLNNAALCDQ